MHNLVPHFILDNFSQQKFRGHFQAISLFIDTSGFTRITAALMQHGKEGAETLAEVLQAIFAPLIQHVYEQGGFIANFSGDGFTALFPGQQTSTYQRALTAAWQIRHYMATHPSYDTRYDPFTFTVKASLADGQVEWGILPGEMARDNGPHVYYFRGQAIDRCIEGEQYIDGGQVVLSQPVYFVLRDHLLAEPVADHFQVKTISGELTTPQEVNLPSPTSEQTAFFPTLHPLALQGEFRQVLTMFVNLQTTDTFDPLPEFMDPCLRLLQVYSGHLGRIARIGGQDAGYTLLLFWGAPTSFENDIERALNFGLDLRQAVSSVSFRAGLTYGVAYAGFVGSTLHEEYTCYGLSVNQAARQMVAANWGDIWLDETTAQRARTSTRPGGTSFNVEFVGHFDFKGFTDKQAVYALRGRQSGHVPTFYEDNLVGRQHELRQLAEFIQPIFAGQFAGVLTMYGEAGIGKSRLLHEFRQQDQARPNGRSSTWCHCPADEIRRQSLNPFRYFLRSYFDQTPGTGRSQTEAENKAHFTQKLETLIARTPNSALQGESERAHLFLGALVDLHWPGSLYEQLAPELRFENTLSALKTLLLAESQIQPVILVLEDAHWLDSDSEQFLKYLTRNVAEYPLAVLVVSREPLPPDLLDPDTPQQTLHLESLTPNEIQALAEAHLAAPLAPALIEVLTRRTDGNPFFIEQLLRYLDEQKLLVTGETGLTLTETNGRIPADVRAVLIARLDCLSAEVREVVQTAAVLGREFELPILAIMLLNDPDIEARVKAAAREAIWSALTDGRYLFKHALMRDAAYDMQLRARLRALHRLAGEAIEQAYATDPAPYYADLTYHYSQAENLERERHYAKLAGEQAAARFANAEAVTYLRRAFELTPETDAAECYALLIALDKVYDLQGQREAQRENLAHLKKLADVLQDDQKRGQIAVCQARYARSMGDSAEAVTAAQAAIDIARQIKDWEVESQGLQNLGFVAKNQGDYTQARRYFEQALRLYQEMGDRPGEAAALGNLGGICSFQGNYAEARAYHEQSLRLAREVGNRQGEGLSLNSLGNIWGRQGDYTQARTFYEQGLAIFREIGYRAGEGLTLHNLGNIALYQGDYATARTYLELSLRIRCELGDQSRVGHLLISLGGVSYRQGDFNLAKTFFEQALRISREMDNPPGEAAALHNLGLMAGDEGAYIQARDYFEQALHLCQQLGDRKGQSLNLRKLGDICSSQGDDAEAQNYYEQARVIKRELGDQVVGD
jgi:predicted ATPase/class 3 adenylate cyclase